jgi:alpha-beta hydrolase superfamily lysophospholipase
MRTKDLKLADGYVMHYHYWKCKGDEKAVMHINHGMAEHSLRYNEFAHYLNKIGISVYAQDHIGHGLAEDQGQLGFFAEEDGWIKVINQAVELSKFIKAENPNLPLILFGHSMGSFIARCILEKADELYTCAIIMGTASTNGLVGKIGRSIANSHIKKKGATFIDKKLDSLAFGAYNKKFDKNGSSFQWLSRDKNIVQKYEDDKWCGFICTSSMYRDLMDMIEEANNKDKINKIRKDIPLLFISGEDDPVGNYVKGVTKAFNIYKESGLKDITLKIIPGAHHELLNEIDKDDTMAILSTWLEMKLK